MKQAILKPTFAVLLLIAMLAGCNKHQDLSTRGEKGSAISSITHKNLDGSLLEMSLIEPFDAVSNDGSMKVVIVPDDIYAVGVASSTSDEQLVETRVVDGVLSVSYTDESSVDNPDNIIYVHSPVIEKVSTTRKGETEAIGYFNTLNVEMTGKGTMMLDGAVHTLNILAGGTGTVDAQGMPAIDVIVTGKSNGLIKVAPVTTLNVNVRGTAKIYYTGSPAVTSTLSGGAQLIHQ